MQIAQKDHAVSYAKSADNGRVQAELMCEGLRHHLSAVMSNNVTLLEENAKLATSVAEKEDHLKNVDETLQDLKHHSNSLVTQLEVVSDENRALTEKLEVCNSQLCDMQTKLQLVEAECSQWRNQNGVLLQKWCQDKRQWISDKQKLEDKYAIRYQEIEKMYKLQKSQFDYMLNSLHTIRHTQLTVNLTSRRHSIDSGIQCHDISVNHSITMNHNEDPPHEPDKLKSRILPALEDYVFPDVGSVVSESESFQSDLSDVQDGTTGYSTTANTSVSLNT